MTTVELKNGYFIEIKKKVYDLKQRYTGKTKDGREKSSVRTIGHFGDMSHAIKGYINRLQLDVLDGERVRLEEYVKTIEQVNKIAVQGVEIAVRGIEGE